MFQAQVARLMPHSLAPKAGNFSPIRPKLTSLRDKLAGPLSEAATILLGLVAFVFLVACANVAHLLLARLVDRRQEFCIRAALGASRARLVQQLATENALLMFAATVSGLGIAWWTSRFLATVLPARISAQSYAILDWRVLGFAIGAAILTGILFGVVPAFLIGRMHPGGDLLRTQMDARSPGVRRLRAALVAIQAAFTVILLAGSVLMGNAFLRLLGTNLGFRTDHMVTLNVSLAGTQYEKRHTVREYYRRALDRLRAIPGVKSAAAVSYLPLVHNSYMGMRFRLGPDIDGPQAITISATPDYFRSIGTAILKGRGFRVTDRATSQSVVIVSEDLARALKAGPHVLGRRIWDWKGKRQFTIVGVIQPIHLGGPMDPAGPQVYFPFEQAPTSFATFVAHVSGNSKPYLERCRNALRQVDPHVPVYDVETLGQRLAENLARPRFYTLATMLLAGFALLLATIGTYGTSSYSVSQRTHEIGVRIAVGASPMKVRLMILRQSMLPLVAGLLVGIAGAVALGRAFEHLISSAQPLGISTYVVASAVLLATAAVAVWSATRRIVYMNLTTTLRTD